MAIQSNSCIAKLSQDHHLEMMFCDRITKGIELGVSLERIKNYITYFWVQHLHHHFIEEEQLLFKNLDDVFCTKGKEDHLFIIAEIEKIISGTNVGQHYVSMLVLALHQHINFEERVLFPHLELLLSKEELQYIQGFLADSHISGFKDDFSDAFWLQTN